MDRDQTSDLLGYPEFISLVIPFYNEEESAPVILKQIADDFKKSKVKSFEIIAIDDGSRDRTIDALHKCGRKIDQLQIISFNRNFGKEAAIHAGLVHAKGQIAVVLDGDGQHPVELIPEMIEKWQTGAKVVAACKSNRGIESIFSKLFAKGFYFTFKILTRIDLKDISDFALLDRAVIDAYCGLNERRRFFRGMISWMGFPTEKVFFDTPERKHGNPSWNKFRLFRFALNAISGFTSTPLHIITLLSFLYAIGAIIIGGISIFQKVTGIGVTGFATVNLLVLITGSLIMFGLGQIGIYLEQVFEELKDRPSYLINDSRSKYSESDKQ